MIVLSQHTQEPAMKTKLAGMAVVLLLTSALPTRAAEPTPKVTVVVGHLLSDEGGPAETPASPLNSPFGIDFDPAGNMTIVELAGGRIHRLTAGGRFTTIAGDGTLGLDIVGGNNMSPLPFVRGHGS